MKAVVWIVLLAIAAVVAATAFGGNDGLVSLYWRGWRVDLSLNLFLLGLVGACVGLLLVLRALQSLLTLPQPARAAWRTCWPPPACTACKTGRSAISRSRSSNSWHGATRRAIAPPTKRTRCWRPNGPSTTATRRARWRCWPPCRRAWRDARRPCG
jgi:uncharacterized membrane-anchored protein